MDKKNKKERVVLLDTHAIIHRAYHALPEFMNSKGEPTGAIYGLVSMFVKIITELEPNYIIACYDLPKKTFRHVAYDDYKAGRAKADDSLVSQLIKSREFFNSISIPIYEYEGFEADDLLGTISHKLKNEKNIEIIIASGDMDTLQLVEKDKVMVYTLKKGISDTILYNEKKVLERYGFLPKSLPDYKALRGDPSDNIIGIKGIGEKTATLLISKYSNIENLYTDIKKKPENLKKIGITDRIFSLLKEGEDEAVFSKTLATIRLDVPVEVNLKNNWRENIDKEKIKEFFSSMEFKTLKDRFFSLIDNNININPNENIKKEENNKTKELIDENDIKKAQIAFWLLNSERTNPEIEDLVNYRNNKNIKESILEMEKEIEKEELSYVYKNIEIPIVDIVKEMEENGIKLDVKYLEKLSKEYHNQLNVLEKDIWKLSNREFNINSPKQLGEILFDELKVNEKKGNTPKIKLKKTSGGARSTKESELEKLRDLHPIINKILEYRELQKLVSTYIDAIPKNIGTDGRLHANFIQHGTTTGRFSSNNPNLQNIPTKSEKGQKIRNAFVSEKGSLLVAFDYSQIELRIAALLSQDEFFINSFVEKKDIHNAVAMKVFKVKENEVTSEMRRRAKVINFGILYGMGVTALASSLGSDRKEAQMFYDNYFDQFPRIKNYLENTKEFAKKNGYTKTLFGRKRYFTAINSKIPFIKAMTERMAMNAPIQGTATADIIKIGMKKIDEELIKNKLKNDVKIVLQVHDELIYEIKEEKLDESIKIIKKTMVDIIPDMFLIGMKKVPLDVSVNHGKTWGDLKG